MKTGSYANLASPVGLPKIKVRTVQPERRINDPKEHFEYFSALKSRLNPQTIYPARVVCEP